MTDHIAASLRAAMALADGANDNDTQEEPIDGYGAGFLTYQIASFFHALCCICGPDEARHEIEEIITSELDRKRS